MSIQTRNNARMPEFANINVQMILISNYIIQQNKEIQHRGHIDNTKA